MARLMAIVLAAVFLAWPARAAPEEGVVRFGLTAVVVRENLRFFDDFADYLSDRLGRPVRFVRRKTYRQIMDLLESGNLEFAWICGYPLVQNRNLEFVVPVAVPIYHGERLYRSYIITHRDNEAEDVLDLRGQVFAFSDPDSNSGYLYPRHLLTRKGQGPDSFFRQTFFTYNHAETVEAVAARVADGGAVESYIWDFLKRQKPDLVARTRIINTSPDFGFPPIVARSGIPNPLVGQMTRILLGLHETGEGLRLLEALNLDGFGRYSPVLYQGIREMMQEVSGVSEHGRLPSSRPAAKR